MLKTTPKLPKYHNAETIPAKVFFEILENRNYTLMKPKNGTKTADLKVIFSKIHDEWFLKSENPNAKDFLEESNRLTAIEYKKDRLKEILKLIWTIPVEVWDEPIVKEQRDGWIDNILNKHFFTPMEKDGVMIEEINRAINVELGIIENDVTQLKISLENMIKETNGKTYDYYDTLVQFGSALPGNTLIKENMTLAVYMAVEKMAVKQSKKQAA